MGLAPMKYFNCAQLGCEHSFFAGAEENGISSGFLYLGSASNQTT